MRRFTNVELLAIEQDALDAHLTLPCVRERDEGHWLGLVVDLARELRRQQEKRDHNGGSGPHVGRAEDALTGRWFREFFSLKFQEGNLPGPRDALYGSRLRVQIDNPEGDWEDWHR